MRRTLLGCAVLTAAVLSLSPPAVAHLSSSAPAEIAPPVVETLSAGAPSLDGLGKLVAAIATVVILLAPHRRAVAVAGMALLLLVAFESGVHSVHHLADQPDTQCVVASASAHIGGVVVTTLAVDHPVECLTTVAVTPTASPVARAAAPDLGRAPPLA